MIHCPHSRAVVRARVPLRKKSPEPLRGIMAHRPYSHAVVRARFVLSNPKSLRLKAPWRGQSHLVVTVKQDVLEMDGSGDTIRILLARERTLANLPTPSRPCGRSRVDLSGSSAVFVNVSVPFELLNRLPPGGAHLVLSISPLYSSQLTFAYCIFSSPKQISYPSCFPSH